MSDRTIEETFDRVWDDFPKGYDDGPAAAAYAVALRAATADGPVFSADGSLAVIRPSRGLTQSLREAKHRIAELESAIAAAMLCADQRVHDPEFGRALSVLWAMAAPADPEGDGE